MDRAQFQTSILVISGTDQILWSTVRIIDVERTLSVHLRNYGYMRLPVNIAARIDTPQELVWSLGTGKHTAVLDATIATSLLGSPEWRLFISRDKYDINVSAPFL
jgi:hypothetical protein